MRSRDAAGGERPRVVVVGGGFAGLQATLHVSREPVEVTLIDRRNFHLFQPLTYQVATGALSPGEVSYPLRAVFRRRPNVRVLMAEVSDVDLAGRELSIRTDAGEGLLATRVPYDTLIVAGGSRYSYFGHPEWKAHAPEPKSLEGALAIRARILGALERAELEPDAGVRRALLTFVVVGAGPTGVEIAGQIAEIVRDTRRDFRSADMRQARILLVEAAPRVLPAFKPASSAAAQRALVRLGVTPMLERTIVEVEETSVTVRAPDGSDERIAARTVTWAAGVEAAGLAGVIARAAGAPTDRAGRLLVGPDLSVPGHPEVLALGDMVQVAGADPLPGLAPVAMQQGRYAARLVHDRLRGRRTAPFRYHDKGNLATIGRGKAVAELPGIRLSGPIAWMTWLVVHLWYLIGFQNRLLVLLRWAFSFFTHGRGARLITAGAAPGGGESARSSVPRAGLEPAPPD